MGRPPRHAGEFVFSDPATGNTPDAATVTQTRLYGTATARVGAAGFDVESITPFFDGFTHGSLLVAKRS